MNVLPLNKSIVEVFASTVVNKADLLYSLPYTDQEVLEEILSMYAGDAGGGRVKAIKMRTLVTDYLMKLGSELETEEAMMESLRTVLDKIGSEDGLFAWFISGIVIQNKKLPIEAFVALSSDEDFKTPLPNLRDEFWNRHNGYTLREKYFNVWLNTSDEGIALKDMPSDYAYRVWFSLVIPEELKQAMPASFSDARLKSS